MSVEAARNQRAFERIKRRFREYDQRKQEADRKTEAAIRCANAMLDRIFAEHRQRND